MIDCCKLFLKEYNVVEFREKDHEKDKKRDLISFGCVFCSSLIMAATTKTFVRPAHLLSGGFMGIALLVDMIADLFGKSIPTAFTLVALNVPVALICAKKISKRFVFFSLLQVFLTSFLLQIIPNYPLFDEQVLNVVFGGYIWGMSIVLALKAGASSGGTDFIALYFANKNGREIWMQVFAFNAMILCIFGVIFGFDKAGYSILFQFISTKTISTFHTRYKRVMLHIYTVKKRRSGGYLFRKIPSWDYCFRWLWRIFTSSCKLFNSNCIKL